MRKRWTIPFIAVCWLAIADPGAPAPSRGAGVAPSRAMAGDAGGVAPGRVVTGAARVPGDAAAATLARHRRADAASCRGCHPGAERVLSGVMGSRAGERAFAHRAMGGDGDRFFDASCSGCHVTGCADCHGAGASFVARPPDEACMRCHRGDRVGWDYHGRGAREDHERYQRGVVADGEAVLKMRPDVHAERGMGCADCHTMRSLEEGRRAAKQCRDCHPTVSMQVPEHAIAAHLDKLECYACHSAWASQEYGTFLVRTPSPEAAAAFAALPRWGEWVKSAVLHRQDAPPLGLDERGRVSPIRPEYVLFATDPTRGWENRLLAAEWTSFFPHSVRPGSVACQGCHDDARRFVLEDPRDRVYRPELDGLPLRSFWDRTGQTMRRGAFFPADRFRAMDRRTPAYIREDLRRWQAILDHVDRSSARSR